MGYAHPFVLPAVPLAAPKVITCDERHPLCKCRLDVERLGPTPAVACRRVQAGGLNRSVNPAVSRRDEMGVYVVPSSHTANTRCCSFM